MIRLRGRHEKTGLDYEVEGTSPLGAVTELGVLLAELDRGITRPNAPATAPPKPAAKVEPTPAAKVEPTPAPITPPSPPPKPSKNGAVCSSCGAKLTDSEERTSRLFLSKLLCKVCLQKI